MTRILASHCTLPLSLRPFSTAYVDARRLLASVSGAGVVDVDSRRLFFFFCLPSNIHKSSRSTSTQLVHFRNDVGRSRRKRGCLRGQRDPERLNFASERSWGRKITRINLAWIEMIFSPSKIYESTGGCWIARLDCSMRSNFIFKCPSLGIKKVQSYIVFFKVSKQR